MLPRERHTAFVATALDAANGGRHVADRMRPEALVTGGSRGIGAATTLALAERGFDVAFTYRNKAARAGEVAARIEQVGARAMARRCDITHPDEVAALCAELRRWCDTLHILVLNASGGMERDLVAADPAYPMRINRDAQLAMLDGVLPLMPPGATVVFVTSHWAHLYGRVQQIPAYEPVAASKHAGEQALRARLDDLRQAGIRLLVVTGDVIEGTITPRLLERTAPGLTSARRDTGGRLPTADDMGRVIADAACDPALPSGHTIVIGAPLDSVGG
jgi:NAD(P)-dependent dehydrogenase (short-subunit alcohol dehydrogenase family)